MTNRYPNSYNEAMHELRADKAAADGEFRDVHVGAIDRVILKDDSAATQQERWSS